MTQAPIAASQRTPRQTIELFLDAISAQRFDELAQLYAVNAEVEHPLGQADQPLRGRHALTAHFAHLEAMKLKLAVTDLLIHDTADAATVVAEFTYRGTIHGGLPVHRRNIFVTTVRDGLIVRSRDYQGDVGPTSSSDGSAS